jgi:Domain of unknown function (DUF4123)
MMIKEEVAKSLADNLFSQEGMNVFAVLDGASIPDLLQTLYEHQPEFVCLYRGQLNPDLASVAPYLVHIRSNTPLADWLIQKGWGEHWGIFAQCDSDLKTMRKHFRKFLTVHDSDGKPLLFRYYDPRVLRLYLPTCNAEELGAIFGPISNYLLEAEDANTLLSFRLDKNELQQQQRSLVAGS